MPVTIDAEPHPAQRIIHNSDARFRVVSAGRRFGKSRLGVMECLGVAAAGGRSWWIAPTYQGAEIGWRPLRRLTAMIPGVKISLADHLITLPNGGEIGARSANNPNALRGEGLDFVVLDEAAYIQREVWDEVIRPTLSDRMGRALFISTPNGRNWFYDIHRRGVALDDGWAAFTFPTSSNPFIQRSEIDAAQRDLPDIVFRQEYMAEFVDMQGSVFRRVQEAASLLPIDGPEDGRRYIAAVDPAASIDYTVVTIWDVQSADCVWMDRFNRVDYNVLEDRLAAIANRWRVISMTIEVNGIGMGVLDHLQARGVPVIPFTTTSATKQAVITRLQSAFEHSELHMINNSVMIGELLSFEARRSPSGSFTYSAPNGMHDDCVMSLAIGWDALRGDNWISAGRY